MKKKILSVLLCAALSATMLAGCGSSSDDTSSSSSDSTSSTDSSSSDSSSDDLIVVGFAQVGHESDWRTASTQSCKDVFSEENGYDLHFTDCDQNSATQIAAVREFIQDDVDYIIIDPIVSTGWDEVLTECEEAGIPVIIIDRTIDDSDKYVCWVGSNFETEGVAAGEWLAAYAAAKGIEELNILVIEGTTGSSAAIGRTDGFASVADANGWTILDSQDGDFTQAGGQEIMESYIKSYSDFNVVVCQNDNEAFGAMQAMDDAGITYGVNGDVILISFDACTAGLEYVITGDITADFECNPLAAPFVEEVIQTLIAGGSVDSEVYMEEHWYVCEDILSSITVNGEEQSLTVVTQEIIDAQY